MMASAEEETEPQLKYELLAGDVRDILSKERITCMTLSEKIVALGTEQGRVHVLDYSGNQVRLLNIHKSRVNDLSFDKEAEHLSSASNDGSVVVTNLYTDQVTRHEFKWPVKVVAVDPRPATTSRRTWRDLATGNASGEVSLHTQGWLGRSDQQLAAAPSRDTAAGGVLAIKWSGALVAWAYHSMVSVYDTTTSQIIRTLRRYDPRADAASAGSPALPVAGATNAATASDRRSGAGAAATPGGIARGVAAGAGGAAGDDFRGLRRCSLLFAPDSHLYVAWSDTILVARIGSYENNVGWLAPQLELVARLRMAEAVLGVSPYGDDDLAVLVYPSRIRPQPQQQQQQQGQGAAARDGGGGGGGGEAQTALEAFGISGSESGSGSATTTAVAAAAVVPADAGTSTATAGPPKSVSDAGVAGGDSGGGEGAARGAVEVGSGGAADGGDVDVPLPPPPAPSPPFPPPLPPPDPLAPGRIPQLLILSRSDHREWARDCVPLPGAHGCGPEDYPGLLPSLPHHLHLPPSTSPAAAATSGTVAVRTTGVGGGGTGAAPGAAASAGPEAVQSGTASRPATVATGQGATAATRNSAGGAAAACAPAPAAATNASTATAVRGEAAGVAAAAKAAPRRLVPVWVDGQELMFFIAGPTAIATARSRDPSDRLTWLLARRRWEEALTVVEAAPPGSLPPGSYDRVVDGYIEELLTRQSYDKAVELSERLLQGDPKRWERWVYLFAQVRQLPKLVPHLPTDKPRLRPQVYDMALQSLLASPTEHSTLVQMAQRWPPGCYSLASLADAVAARLRRMQAQQQHQNHHPQQPQAQPQLWQMTKLTQAHPVMGLGQAAEVAACGGGGGGGQGGGSGEAWAAGRGGAGGGVDSDPLWQLLAWLYEQQGRPDLALSIHLRLRSPHVFTFIMQHGLQANLLGRAPNLLEVDERAALSLLSTAADSLPPSNVVPSLQEAIRAAPTPAEAEVWRRRLFAYLQGLFAADSTVGADYHDLQVSLTAEYQPSKLMDLLVSSQYYSLEAALAICETRGLVSEQVFVLGRMGNADQALRLIIDQLGDIPRAIDFVVGQRDDELWGRLIDWALGSPETTGALLDCIGGYVDPLLLVRRIPRGMRVERLRDRLRAIIADYRTQTSLREGCNAILRSDCRHLLAKLYDGTRRALAYVYMHHPGTGGEAGQWYRCDVVHGAKLQPVNHTEVPWGAAASQSAQQSPSSSPPSAAAATAAAANPLHPNHYGSRGSGDNLALLSAATATAAHAGGGGGGLTRAHGASAPALYRAEAAATAGAVAGAPRGPRGRDRCGDHDAAAVTDGLPWWALMDGPDSGGRGRLGALQPAMWVGFTRSAGRVRLGGEDAAAGGTFSGGVGSAAAAVGGGVGRPGSRRAGSGARSSQSGPSADGAAVSGRLGPGLGQGRGWGGAAGVSGAGGGGGGDGSGGSSLGSLWQHVVTRL